MLLTQTEKFKIGILATRNEQDEDGSIGTNGAPGYVRNVEPITTQ